MSWERYIFGAVHWGLFSVKLLWEDPFADSYGASHLDSFAFHAHFVKLLIADHLRYLFSEGLFC